VNGFQSLQKNERKNRKKERKKEKKKKKKKKKYLVVDKVGAAPIALSSAANRLPLIHQFHQRKMIRSYK
jgi:hypothetical protein